MKTYTTSAATDFRIIMPVYNEGFLLEEMLAKIPEGDTGILERILVIDDASTDHITAVILARWRMKGLDVMTVAPDEKKSPKRDAIIKAVRYLRETDQMPAKLVFTDGDTFLKAHESYHTLSDALEAAIEDKDQRGLTAVSFPIVPIRRNFLTYIEKLEFVLERTQRWLLNYVRINPVLSGAASIIDSRVYESMMEDLVEGHDLADDMHITLLLQKEGYLTGYARGFALAFSDMPTTLPGLLKQRIRWFMVFFKSANRERRAILAQAVRLKPWALYRILAILALVWPGAFFALTGIAGLVPLSPQSGATGIQFAAWCLLITFVFLLTPEHYQENRIKMLAHVPIVAIYQIMHISVVQMLGIAGLLGVNVDRIIDRCSSLWSSLSSYWSWIGRMTTKTDPLSAATGLHSETASTQKSHRIFRNYLRGLPRPPKLISKKNRGLLS